METVEECQVKKLPIKKIYQSKKKNMGPYKLLQPPRRWSRPHEPTSIMANAQRKIKIELGGHGYHTVFILV